MILQKAAKTSAAVIGKGNFHITSPLFRQIEKVKLKT